VRSTTSSAAIHRFSHYFTYEGETYAVFTFREKPDAESFMTASEGEPFDLWGCR